MKERGLLDSTLVIWGGEFGRTPTAQPTTGVPGRDHNGKSMMAWMAGGGVKAGTVVGTPYANDRKEDGDYSGISICFKVSEVDAMAAKLTSEDKK